MADLKKWLCKRNEGGFINKEHEQLERYLMYGAGLLITMTFFYLVAQVVVEA